MHASIGVVLFTLSVLLCASTSHAAPVDAGNVCSGSPVGHTVQPMYKSQIVVGKPMGLETYVSPDNEFLVIQGNSTDANPYGTMASFRISDGMLMWYGVPVNSFVLMARGAVLTYNVGQGNITAWDLSTGKVTWAYPQGAQVFEQPYVSSDGNTALIPSGSQQWDAVDVVSGTKRWSIDNVMGAPDMDKDGTVVFHTMATTLIAVDLHTGKVLFRNDKMEKEPTPRAILNGGKYVLVSVSSSLSKYQLWSIPEGKMLWEVDAHYAICVVGGRYIVQSGATASGQGAYSLVDATTGKQIRQFKLSSAGMVYCAGATAPSNSSLYDFQVVPDYQIPTTVLTRFSSSNIAGDAPPTLSLVAKNGTIYERSNGNNVATCAQKRNDAVARRFVFNVIPGDNQKKTLYSPAYFTASSQNKGFQVVNTDSRFVALMIPVLPAQSPTLLIHGWSTE